MTSPPSTLNLGIVAHVDAGKTSLTERLLFEAGAIDAPGSVDAGTTRTDSLELERRRGITIRAAVTSFALDDLVVNLLDTPGHPDFIAEVERSLGVLDAAVLVLSSVEGVQPQTVVIWRALQRIGVPTILFVNKVDRSGADVDGVLDQVRHRLTPYVVPLAHAHDAGTRDARVTAVPLTSDDVVVALAEGDDRVLDVWAAGRPVDDAAARAALRRGLRTGGLTPALCGSAITGAGLPLLRDALVTLLPRSAAPPGPRAATVFAVDRDARGRRAWVRVWSGALQVRDRVAFGAAEPARVTEVAVSTPAGLRPGVAGAGQIAVVRGPSARIGDAVGRPPARRVHRFTPASLQALVEPVDASRRTALYAGLAELADEDPLIDLRLDEVDGEAAVSLHGEVQKEVLAALLEERYGVAVRFLDTSTVCLERVVGVGTSADRIGAGGNPYLAGLGLRVEAAPVGHGVEFSPGVERGNLPPAFVAAAEEGVRGGLRQGPHGWEVTDCVVTMTASAYYPRQSRPHQKFDKSISTVAADFRHLAPVVLAAALQEARTRVCRPVDRFELDLPAPAYPAVAALLGRLGAALVETSTSGGYTRLVGHLPSQVVPDVASRLPDLTGGEGVLVTVLDHHAPVPGRPPRRRRHGPDPLDRTRWFRDVPR
ncbi:translation factor GTPase family protein [Nocardioides renjunii]|uniref:translation factor GTPase family protein n=1 Tax=Nocardioides renjunii TaxID=3095075 RepID=UPI002AFF96E8|nr:translation factor GTPase family protein [Nocardioides sp. S-34]WQQ20378.1 translation factor GTPase family protein [Nocardioides sp. S-34]